VAKQWSFDNQPGRKNNLRSSGYPLDKTSEGGKDDVGKMMMMLWEGKMMCLYSISKQISIQADLHQQDARTG
jgi:hypothetical protein